MKHFFIAITIVLTAAALTSCDLIFGPLSQVSLQQQIEEGWGSREDVFSVATNGYFYNTTGKLALFRSNDKMGGIFGAAYNPGQQVFHFTKDGTAVLQTNITSGGLLNIFDYILDGTSYYAMISSNSAPPSFELFKDDFLNNSWYSPPFSATSPVFLMNDRSVIGYNSMDYSIISSPWGSGITNQLWNIGGYAYGLFMTKCQNQYKDHSIIAVAVNTNNMFPQYSLSILDVDSKTLLNANSPLSLTSSNESCALVSDNTNLFLLYKNVLYKHGDNNNFAPSAVLNNVPSGDKSFKSGVIVNGVLYVLYAGNENNNTVAKIISLNIASGSSVVYELTGLNSAGILYGADLYYDEIDGTLYAGFVELSGDSWKGYWLKNMLR